MKLKYESLGEQQSSFFCVFFGTMLAIVILTLFSIGDSYTHSVSGMVGVIFTFMAAIFYWCLGYCSNVFEFDFSVHNYLNTKKNYIWLIVSLGYMVMLFLNIYNTCGIPNENTGKIFVYSYMLPVEALIFLTAPYIMGFYSSKHWD